MESASTTGTSPARMREGEIIVALLRAGKIAEALEIAVPRPSPPSAQDRYDRGATVATTEPATCHSMSHDHHRDEGPAQTSTL